VSGLLVVTAVGVEARGLARLLGLIRHRGAIDLRDGSHRGSAIDLRDGPRQGGAADLRDGSHQGGAADLRDGSRPSSAVDFLYQGSGVVLACAGPRALRLPRLADLARSARLVVSAGTCGALAPHLVEGDLVVPETVLAPGGCGHGLPVPPGLSPAGTLLSVDRVVESAEGKARFWRETGALAVDMESAAVVQWATRLGLPAVVIRGVSDTAAHGVPAALADVVGVDGRVRLDRAVRALVAHPHILSRALALRRGTNAALRQVAGALRILASGDVSGRPATATARPVLPGATGGRTPTDVGGKPAMHGGAAPSSRAVPR
jgi:adenosylhomocysteine nucleosidase